MDDNLKPCPWCGSTDISLGEICSKDMETGDFYSQTECLNCGAAGPKLNLEGFTSGQNHEKEIDLWNSHTKETE